MRSSGLMTPPMLIFLGFLMISILVATARWQLDSRLKMARTHAHFTEAVNISKHTLAQQELDQQPHKYNTGSWITLFATQAYNAPDGGPAFIVNKAGNSSTGAIGVSATNYGSEVHLSRPSYRSLTNHKIIVKAHEVVHEPPLDKLSRL